jgi:hypothetical protein
MTAILAMNESDAILLPAAFALVPPRARHRLSANPSERLRGRPMLTEAAWGGPGGPTRPARPCLERDRLRQGRILFLYLDSQNRVANARMRATVAFYNLGRDPNKDRRDRRGAVIWTMRTSAACMS